LASLTILAGGIATLYGLDWYKNRKQIRKSTKRLVSDEDYYTTKEPVAEQLANTNSKYDNSHFMMFTSIVFLSCNILILQFPSI
jgi:hypothetical protein